MKNVPNVGDVLVAKFDLHASYTGTTDFVCISVGSCLIVTDVKRVSGGYINIMRVTGIDNVGRSVQTEVYEEAVWAAFRRLG